MKSRKIVSYAASILIVLAFAVFSYQLQHELPKPSDWPANVKIYRRAITGETRVFDANSGKFLFSYRPEYDPNVRPVKIEQLDTNHWQVIFENPVSK